MVVPLDRFIVLLFDCLMGLPEEEEDASSLSLSSCFRCRRSFCLFVMPTGSLAKLYSVADRNNHASNGGGDDDDQ